MAYYSQEQKKQVAPIIKAICAKFGVKGSLSVHGGSEVIFTATSGSIDFIGNANKIEEKKALMREEKFYPYVGDVQVNQYSINKSFNDKACEFLQEIYKALMVGNYDDSDSQRDYFDAGYYVSLQIGKWDKPYEFKG